jgi:hypothetical protein
MSPAEWRSRLLVVCSLLSAACGGDPPDKEMQQARASIESARIAGAPRLAREEYVAAEQALQRAEQAVKDRDYRLALSNAIDSRERAQTSLRLAADIKAKARSDLDRALGEAAAAITDARGRLRGARLPARTVAAVQRSISDTEGAVQEARLAVEAGELDGIIARLNEATLTLQARIRDLEAASTAGARRRR